MTQRAQSVLGSSLQALLALVVLTNCHAQNSSQQDTIARIADQFTITFPELQQQVHDYHYAQRFRKRLAMGFEKALDDMIVDQLKRTDFFALGLNRTAESLQRMRRSINEELAIRYYQSQFYEKYVNEDSMQSAYKEMGREVIYQRIVLGKPKNASQKDIDSLKSLANAIRMRIRKGEDFVALAKQYSQDREARSGHILQTMNWEMSVSDSLSYALFHLPVNEVRILESGIALHIVQIVRITTKGVPPYTTVREKIRKALDGMYSNLSYEKFERAKKNLVDETKAKWNPQALRQLVQWSNIPRFYQTSYADSLRDAIARGQNFVILKHPKVQVDLKEYLRLLNDVLTWGDYVSVNQKDVQKFVLEAVRTSMIVDKAVKLGLEKDAFTPSTRNPVLKYEIVQLYNRHEIEEHIPPATEHALMEFYRANKDSMYYQLAKVNIQAVIDSSRNVIDGLKEKLHQNIPFQKLVPEILVKTYVRKRDGTLATYFGDEPPFLAEAAFKLKLNEVAGPIEYVDPEKGKEYALIGCIGTQEEKQLSYEDVKKRITDEFANYHRERIARSVAEQLRRKYSVTIYRDVLNKHLLSMGINPQ